MRPTAVVNRRACPDAPDLTYIGRGSDWGNPYVIGKDGTREECIRQHKSYLLGQADLLKRVGELRGRVLACYCKPAACHGDTLARLADAWPDLGPVLDALRAEAAEQSATPTLFDGEE